MVLLFIFSYCLNMSKKKIYIKRQKRLFNNSLFDLILYLLNSNYFFVLKSKFSFLTIDFAEDFLLTISSS